MLIPKNELGVIVNFAQVCGSYGWEIVGIRGNYPDAIIKNNETGEMLRVEFEFLSSNFIQHKHDPRECDLIVCWMRDEQHIVLPIIELQDMGTFDFEIVSDDEKEIYYLRLQNSRLQREVAKLHNNMRIKEKKRTRRRLVASQMPPEGEGWRIEFMNCGKNWIWRRGSKDKRESKYGGKIESLPDDWLEKYRTNLQPNKKLVDTHV